MKNISVETFYLDMPKRTQKEIAKHQQKWRDAFNKDGSEYFVCAIQPLAFTGKIKVSIIPAKIGNKIQKIISA